MRKLAIVALAMTAMLFAGLHTLTADATTMDRLGSAWRESLFADRERHCLPSQQPSGKTRLHARNALGLREREMLVRRLRQ